MDEGISCECDELIGFNNSVEVFIGRVNKMEFIEETYEAEINLELKSYFKGELENKEIIENIKVRSFLSVCGYKWNLSEFYLVFVERLEKEVRIVNMCSLTTKINYEYDLNGSHIGIPNLEEVEKWGWNNEIRKKYEISN